MKTVLYIVLIMLINGVSSCSNKTNRNEDMALSMYNKEVLFPDSFVVTIQNDTIVFAFDSNEFNIITIVDSANCTHCRMHLKKWSSTLDKLKKISDVGFLMIVHSSDRHEIEWSQVADDFSHPITIDSLGIFAQLNELPQNRIFRTFLIDSYNHIKLIGDPTINPKVFDQYCNVLGGGDPQNFELREKNNFDTTFNIGVLEKFHNNECVIDLNKIVKSKSEISDIIVSCDCLTSQIIERCSENDSTLALKIDWYVDTDEEYLSNYIDLYMTKESYPYRICVYGYLKNDNNLTQNN